MEVDIYVNWLAYQKSRKSCNYEPGTLLICHTKTEEENIEIEIFNTTV